jgi:hypothetical protein
MQNFSHLDAAGQKFQADERDRKGMSDVDAVIRRVRVKGRLLFCCNAEGESRDAIRNPTRGTGTRFGNLDFRY